MEKPLHTLCDLFEQLGLPCTDADIDEFIESHRPLAADIQLVNAPFWNPSQRQFLEQQLTADADWAELVDQLNGRLR